MPKVILKPQSNFDLLPKNPQPVFLELTATKINVEVEIETKAPNSAKTDRWTKVAEAEMERYREIVVETVEKITAPWDKNNVPLSDRQKEAETLVKSINKACASMEAAIQTVVTKQIAREAQGDKNLLEAKISVAVKGTFKVIAIGKDVAEIAVTAGANVKAWVSLAKDIYGLAKLINDQCKDEPALRTDLLKAIGEYCSEKTLMYNQEAKVADKADKAKLWVKKVWVKYKDRAGKCEEQRKKYRNEVTSMIQKVDKLGAARDELLTKMKSFMKVDATGLQAGKEMIKLGSSMKTMNTMILECQEFVDDMAMLLTENNIAVDDRTAVQKIKALKGLSSFVTTGKDILTAASNLKDIVDAIK